MNLDTTLPIGVSFPTEMSLSGFLRKMIGGISICMTYSQED